MARLYLALLSLTAIWGAEVTGRVVDATTAEPIAKVAIRDLEADARYATDQEGRFRIGGSPRQVLFSSVGYRPLRVNVEGTEYVEVQLVPDTLRQKESIEVSAGPFAIEAPNSLSLAGNELRNLASVLADDPLRAVQGLPGVNANDDFQSQITFRGAPFNRIGIYLDGVLLHSPFHSLQADPSGASLTILSSDMLESAVLYPGAPPPAFSDRTAGALDLRLRDGDRKRFTGRASASASNAGMSLEGPLGKGRGSWLISARKSYLQYIIKQSSDDPSIAFGFSDAQGRVAFDLTPRHTAVLSLMHGSSGLDRSGAENQLGLNAFFRSGYDFTVAKAGSRWSPNGTLLFNSSIGWMRERFDNVNRERNPLAHGHYGEWIALSDNTWQWNERALLSFGGVLRKLRDDGYLDRRNAAPPQAVRLDAWNGNAWRGGAHLAQQFSTLRGRVIVRAGGRWDGHSVAAGGVLTPNIQSTLRLASMSTLHLAFGSYVQYPELAQLYSRLGRTSLVAERANHLNAALEQRIGERTRVRAEVYQRLDRDLIFRPLFDPRIVGGRPVAGSNTARYENSLRGHSRGFQLLLQRRTTNGLTGWVSYSYTNTRLRDGILDISFPADFDQRHTANFFLSYRLRPTVNLSSRWTYGSGFPVRGFYQGNQPQFVLSASRNQLRLPAFHRLDFRANKTFVRKGWHITLFAEVVNLYNRRNVRFDDIRGLDLRTGAARLGFERMFPILPSAGVAVEF